ncbi:MAG: hypothetical protein ACD_19C00172G0002 [uncultured bacterium]|nr:MAG: hypothetical protein ACD_19C00172G0002 [uncultured bacterium]
MFFKTATGLLRGQMNEIIKLRNKPKITEIPKAKNISQKVTEPLNLKYPHKTTIVAII